MRVLSTWLCYAATAAALLGCDAGDDVGGVEDADADADEAVTPRKVQSNGVQLNGIRLNGIRLNGIRLNGIRLNGDGVNPDYIEVLGVELPGWQEAVDSWLANGDLHVMTDLGQVLSEMDIKDMIVAVEVREGGLVKHREMMVKSVVELGAGSGIWAYDLDVRDNGGPWQPLCTDDAGARTQAILLEDVWVPTGARVSPRPSGALTFACRNAALGKCVEFGYAPWKAKNGVSLAEYHQACTRMVRADYCGNGASHTVVGTPVHVLDPLAVQAVEANKPYVVEAEWGPNGATCLNPKNTRLPGVVPGCSRPVCGASFASGGLIQSGKLVP